MPHSVNKKIRVLIVDDSALIRALLIDILTSDPRIEVIAEAKDAFEARDMIKKYNPDVLTLDIEMPKMNGITFLKNLMRLRPMPVLMISTLTQSGAPKTLEALELGAVDYVAKPEGGGAQLAQYRDSIIEKVINAAKARVRTTEEKPSTTQVNNSVKSNASFLAGKRIRPGFICAIGASTGGTEALKDVITALPPKSPPVVVVQHIPESFSTSYAQRVDKHSAVNVYEARDGQKIESGSVYIAPGNKHLRVVREHGQVLCRLSEDALVNRHRPAVEVLFDSVLETYGSKALGVLLTGMGGDGAQALLRMRQALCETIAQDEESSVVWGMPGMAVKLGAANQILPLNKITRAILSAAVL